MPARGAGDSLYQNLMAVARSAGCGALDLQLDFVAERLFVKWGRLV
jgi:hypothetical protein